MIQFRTKKILKNTIGDGNMFDMLPKFPKKLEKFRLRECLVVPVIFTLLLHSVQLMAVIDFVLNIRVDLLRACSSLAQAFR